MTRAFFLALILFVSVAMSAQDNKGIQPEDPAFIAKYADFKFMGQFAVSIEQNDLKKYFLLDFSIFTSRFERVYFMNLSFTSKEIINIDPDITKDRICFMSDRTYPETEIKAIFDDLKKMTITVATTMPEAEKLRWLKENDKYK